MRELHVVAMSEDGRHVVLATRKGAASGDYRVALDERLAAAVRGDLPRPGEETPAVVTPKEIQARLRAGESTDQVAASAGVPVAKIDRYAGPVLAERERVIAQARAGFVSRSRLGASALPLGEAVDRHLSMTTGVRLETVTWSTRREDSGTWLVQLSYVSQARRRTATWRYDGVRREVTAVDSASAQLAHVEPGRRSAEPAAPRPAAARPAGRSGGRRAPVRAAAAVTTRTVAARPAAPVRAAQPAADRAAAAQTVREQAARTAAQEKAATAASTKAARAAAAAEQAAAVQTRAAEARAAEKARKAAAERKAEAERRAAAEAARQAKAEAARKAKAEAAKQAKAEAAKQAKAEAVRKAKAEAAKQAKAEAAKQAKAEAAKQAKAEAAKQAEQEAAAPTGPPTLRVVGAEDAPARRGPKAPPAAARTAPARAAGQRASVPGWADVLLSTAPVARSTDPEPDEG